MESCSFQNVKKQSLTGITIDGARFPLSVSIKLVKDFEDAGDDTGKHHIFLRSDQVVVHAD